MYWAIGIVAAVSGMVVIWWLATRQARRRAPAPGDRVRAELEAMLPRVDIQWPEIYERFNPENDERVKTTLDGFRNSGYQFNAHLALKVLAAAYEGLAKSREGSHELDQLLGKPEARGAIELDEVIREALRQTQRVGHRHH